MKHMKFFAILVSLVLLATFCSTGKNRPEQAEFPTMTGFIDEGIFRLYVNEKPVRTTSFSWKADGSYQSGTTLTLVNQSDYCSFAIRVNEAGQWTSIQGECPYSHLNILRNKNSAYIIIRGKTSNMQLRPGAIPYLGANPALMSMAVRSYDQVKAGKQTLSVLSITSKIELLESKIERLNQSEWKVNSQSLKLVRYLYGGSDGESFIYADENGRIILWDIPFECKIYVRQGYEELLKLLEVNTRDSIPQCEVKADKNVPVPVRDNTVRDYWPTKDWKESTPEQQGMDSQILAKMKPYIEKELPNIRSVLIVRHGYLAYEQYFQYYNRDYKQNVYSMTKSISSALVGIALKEGYLKSLDQKLVDFFPEYVTPEVDPRVRQITLKHLLTMSSGFDHKDINWKMTKEKIHQKPVHEPGEIFAYDNDAVDLLSPIMIKVTNRSMLDFAKDKLFAPLGISEVTWWTWPIRSFDMGSFEELYNHASFGISLKPRDMAKFGYLYLNNGFWDAKQILPSDFVNDSTQKHIKTNWPIKDYGYLWWIHKVEEHPAYLAAGSDGQYIYVIPDLDMVIVITSGREEPYWVNITLIGKFIVPSILKK